MKKFALLFAFAMFLSFVVTAQTLTWQFANAEVINAGTQFQFDVEVKADVATTDHRDLQVYFDYNTAGFGSDIVANGYVMVTPLTLMDDYYSIVNYTDNTSSKFAIITEADNEMVSVGGSGDFNPMPTTFTGLLRITIDIMSNTETAGIVFDEALMNGGQYYQETGTTNPMKYVDPCVYDNDLDLFKLSTLYGQVTYANVASTPLSSTTVSLYSGAVLLGTADTDASGFYSFSGLDDGTFTLETTSALAWGPCNIFDINIMVAYLTFATTLDPMQQLAAELDLAAPINIFDVNYMVSFLTFAVPAPGNPGSWPAPPYVFDVQSADVSSGIGMHDYQGVCSGDVDLSNTP